jgi:hypothetical protein
VFSGLVEFERHLIAARTSEGRKRAKANVVLFGRPRKLTPHGPRGAQACGGRRAAARDRAELQRRSFTDQSAQGALEFVQEEDGGMKKRQVREGQIVRVVDGPLTGFRGEVKEVDEQTATAKVAVQAFGRVASMDLALEQIKRVSENSN